MAQQTPTKISHWDVLVESHLDPLEPHSSPVADIKETIDIADVLLKQETERRDTLALNAPQAYNSPFEAPIFVPEEREIHVDPNSSPEASPVRSSTPDPVSATTEGSVSKEVRSPSPSRRPTPRILSIKRSTLFIWIILSLTIILVATVGALGGVLAHRKKSKENIAVDGSSSDASSPSSDGSDGKQRMTFSLQTWEFTNLTGRSQIFYEEGHFKTSFQTRAYSWEIGAYVDDPKLWEVCSMAFCLDDTEIGWWGSSAHVGLQTNWQKVEELANVDYGDVVVVKCLGTFADPGCPVNMAATSTYATVPVFHVTSTPSTSPSKTATRTSGASANAKTTGTE